MENIKDIIICPLCKSSLEEDLSCKSCDTEFSFQNGVYNILSDKLSGDQESLWEMTEEKIESDLDRIKSDYVKRKEEYDSYKSMETIEAAVKAKEYMRSEIESFSGMVLDLATGMGSNLQNLLDSDNKDFKIVCSDFDPKILMYTRKLRKTDDKRIAYIGTDGRYLSIADNTFDYITSLAGLGNIPETEKVLNELYRVLKPHGKLIIQGGYVEKNTASHKLSEEVNIHRGLIEEYLIEDLTRAGFKNIKSEIIAESIWSENPFDLLPVAGDKNLECIIKAEKI